MYLTFWEKNKKLQMQLLLHNVIFNEYIYIYIKFEINPMNEKYPKNTLKTL